MEDCFFGRKISLKSQTEFDSLVFKSTTKSTMNVKYHGCDRLGNLTDNGLEFQRNSTHGKSGSRNHL